MSERFPQLFSLSLGKEATMADLVCLKDGEGFGSGGGGEVFFQWEEEQLLELQTLILQSGLKGVGDDK